MTNAEMDVSTRGVLCLCVSIYLLATGYLPGSSLLSSLEAALGYYTLGVSYLGFGVAALASPAILRHYGSRRSLLIGCIPYIIFASLLTILPQLTSASTTLAYLIMIPAAAVQGAGTALYWASTAVYLVEAAQQKASAQQQAGCTSSATSSSYLGRYNSYYFATFQCANVIANIVTSSMLTAGVTPTSIFIGATGLMILGTVACYIAPAHTQADQAQRATPAPSIIQLLQHLYHTIMTPDIYLLLPLCVCQGLLAGYIYGSFTADVISASPVLGLDSIGYVLVVCSAADALSAMACARLTDPQRAKQIHSQQEPLIQHGDTADSGQMMESNGIHQTLESQAPSASRTPSPSLSPSSSPSSIWCIPYVGRYMVLLFGLGVVCLACLILGTSSSSWLLESRAFIYCAVLMFGIADGTLTTQLPAILGTKHPHKHQQYTHHQERSHQTNTDTDLVPASTSTVLGRRPLRPSTESAFAVYYLFTGFGGAFAFGLGAQSLSFQSQTWIVVIVVLISALTLTHLHWNVSDINQPTTTTKDSDSADEQQPLADM